MITLDKSAHSIAGTKFIFALGVFTQFLITALVLIWIIDGIDLFWQLFVLIFGSWYRLYTLFIVRGLIKNGKK